MLFDISLRDQSNSVNDFSDYIGVFNLVLSPSRQESCQEVMVVEESPRRSFYSGMYVAKHC